MTGGKSAQPKTFQSRGVFIGFEKESIALARLRVQERTHDVEWELKLPMDSKKPGGAIMILPWRQLLSYTSLSARDKALWATIDDIDDTDPDPYTIMLIRDQVDAACNTSAAIRDAARTRRAAAEEARDRAYIGFLAEMTREAGIQLGDQTMVRIDAATLANIMKRGADLSAAAPINPDQLRSTVLGFFAKTLNGSLDQVTQMLEEFSDLAAPMGYIGGTNETGVAGLFPAIAEQLAAFEQSMGGFEGQAFSEHANMAAMCRFAAKDFLKFVRQKINLGATLCSRFTALLRRPAAARAQLNQIRRSLSYALDGWEGLIAAWMAVEANGTYADKVEVLTHCFHNLPVMPAQECEAGSDREKIWSGFEGARTKVVKAMVSWNGNSVDSELAERVKAGQDRLIRERVQAEAARAAQGRRRREK